MNRALRRKQAKTVTKQVQPVGLQLLEVADAMRHGQWLPARKRCQQILKEHPRDYNALQLMGVICHQLKDVKAGRSYLEQSLAIYEDQPHVWYNYGKVLVDCGEPDAALKAYAQALNREPEHIEARFNRANLYNMLHRHAEAIAGFEAVLALQPLYGEAQCRLALTFQEIGQDEKALETMRDLVAKHPDSGEFHRVYGVMLMENGHKDTAMAMLEKALAQEPENITTHYDVAQLIRYSAEAPYNKEAMESLLKQANTPSDQARLQFALAKAHEEMGDMQTAFAYYDAGNATIRATMKWDTKQMRDYVDAAITMDGEENKKEGSRPDPALSLSHRGGQEAVAGDNKKIPIFILGMPRSGTSLVEQMLASHSQVSGAGELSALHDVVMDGKPFYDLKRVRELGQLSDEDWQAMGERYLERLAAVAGDTPYVCDKMPGNFLYAGWIHRMLPQARIIHCQRNALDTCLSLYKRLFFGQHPYAYHQVELAEYFQQYERLMAHWSDAVYAVAYEALVASPQDELRKLLAFCDLEWEEACLRFHTNTRAVHTASSMQVREPIYARAIDSWKPVAPYIQDMIQRLAQHERNG